MVRRKKVKTTQRQGIVRIKLVKRSVEYRGARAAWYEVLRRHDGKSVDSFMKTTIDKPPALTKKGEAENPKGWLRFFTRTGVAKLNMEGHSNAD